MKDEIIAVKPVAQLLGEDFVIPSYQRGYRWTPKQVEDLLEDIYAFYKDKEKAKNQFYCLQPIVVSKIDGSYHLIDGQQRLTTIFLILQCTEDIRKILGLGNFNISYKTREKSEEFLKNLDMSHREDNIDFFHMAEAVDTIKEWFASKDPITRTDFLQVLLRGGDDEQNVRVIWYEIYGEESQLIDVFTRINIGKIPLTNAELIKALILSEQANVLPKSNEATRIRQLEIANDWDRIEQTLRNEQVWYFIQDNVKHYENRIEFLFDLIANNDSIDPYYTFRYYSNRIKEGAQVVDLWKELKTLFMSITEWFNNREYFHLVGFLIATGTSIHKLINWSQANTKSDFKTLLKNDIIEQVELDNIENLSYFDDNKLLKDTLLLFNIISIINSENESLKFQFDKFKEFNWDIEHIHSVTTEMPERKNHQEDWLEEILKYSKKKEVIAIAKEYLNKKPSERDFEKSYDKIVRAYSVNQEIVDIDDISNLALLDSGTNRGYKNSVFPIKRDKIIEKEKQGVFIPLCTKNAFLKYYSKGVERMTFWEKEDRKAYKESIINTIEDYLIN